MENRSLKLNDYLILLGCVLLMGTTMGIVNVVLTLFYPLVSLDLGVSRASFALTGTITALSSMVAALFWGFYYSRKPLQRGMVISIIVIGLALFAQQAARNLYQFYALALVIGISFGGISIIPVSIIITRHFTSKTGLMLSIAMAGVGFGAMVLNPIINTIINNAGWRVGYLVLALVIFFITLPCAIMVTSLTKSEIQTRQTKSEVKIEGTVTSPVKQTWLWSFLLGAFLSGVTGAAVLANLPTYMKDLNFSVSRISIVSSAYSASLVFNKFILGFLYDRFGAKVATLTASLLMTLSLVLLMVIDTPIMLILMIFTIGMGLSVGTVTITWLANYFFSKEEFSKYYGTVQFANSLGMAVGVPSIAFGLENLANTNLLWLVLTVLCLGMVALFMVSIRGNQNYKAANIISSIERAKAS